MKPFKNQQVSFHKQETLLAYSVEGDLSHFNMKSPQHFINRDKGKLLMAMER